MNLAEQLTKVKTMGDRIANPAASYSHLVFSLGPFPRLTEQSRASRKER